MRKKYSIGIFILSVLFIYFISYGAYNEHNKKSDQNIYANSTLDKPHVNEQGFYLFEKNGYVVVFEYDKITPYEYTDIPYEELPELLKQEIRNGKYIKNAEELYGFLENYTS